MTTTLHRPPPDAGAPDELEAQVDTIGRAWLRCLRGYGRHEARPLERLFQLSLNELHLAGRPEAAGRIQRAAEAQAGEGRPGCIG